MHLYKVCNSSGIRRIISDGFVEQRSYQNAVVHKVTCYWTDDPQQKAEAIILVKKISIFKRVWRLFANETPAGRYQQIGDRPYSGE